MEYFEILENVLGPCCPGLQINTLLCHSTETVKFLRLMNRSMCKYNAPFQSFVK